MNQAALDIDNLSIAFQRDESWYFAVAGINLSIAPGRCLALLGESGSGKSLTALSSLQCLPPAAHVSQQSQIKLHDQSLLSLSRAQMQTLLGHHISVVFQDALSAFNPVRRIGKQLCQLSGSNKQLILQRLQEVGLPDPEQVYHAYPHQLSGGMTQRVMIALALLGKPKLLIADEPTTALDTLVAERILRLLKTLQREHGFAMLFITHNIQVARALADDVAVMQHGRIIEQQTAQRFFQAPQHPYSQTLAAAVLETNACLAAKADAEPVLSLQKINMCFKGKRRSKPVQALSDVDLTLYEGQTTALVGGSGSGKTTLARILCAQQRASSGHIQWHQAQQHQHAIQMIFQDPFSAFNPRMSIANTLIESLSKHQTASGKILIKAASNMLERVGISVSRLHAYPHEFSGGERQRIAIARALTAKPQCLILDEPTSALDVAIQQRIIELLENLQSEEQISYLLITHDMGLVARLAHRVLVLETGQVVEQGNTQAVFADPKHAYTQALLQAATVAEVTHDKQTASVGTD